MVALCDLVGEHLFGLAQGLELARLGCKLMIQGVQAQTLAGTARTGECGRQHDHCGREGQLKRMRGEVGGRQRPQA